MTDMLRETQPYTGAVVVEMDEYFARRKVRKPVA